MSEWSFQKGMSVQPFVHSLLAQAAEMGASDIHIEPLDRNVRVRFRIDGILQTIGHMETTFLSPVSARIKVMSHMDIANTRLPMDGRCIWKGKNHMLDVRVSTMPTVRGEKIVLRLFADHQPFHLDELIPYEPSRQLLRRIVRGSQGLFLICGPTGSGKTTTLYALLRELDSPEISIATLEDPVELRVNGFCQSQIHEKGGLAFQNGLRALLRQDPDILVIGEIRDAQTAGIALQAALTGHRVFSTLHTARAVDVPLRLLDMGLEPFLVAEALSGMASQRLARYRTEDGYRGRFCLCEVVRSGPSMRQAVQKREERKKLLEAASKDKAVFMNECIRHALREQLTDEKEIHRIYEEEGDDVDC